MVFATGQVNSVSEKVRTSDGSFGIGVPNVRVQVKFVTNKHLYFQKYWRN